MAKNSGNSGLRPGLCSVCHHPSLAEIDRALMNGLSLRHPFPFSPFRPHASCGMIIQRSTPCLSISPPNIPKFPPATWAS
jgi:hypothetical protein